MLAAEDSNIISVSRRRMAMVFLFVVSTFNYIDRTIISVLQVPIKRDLGLSDAQLGLLTGLSFAIFYTSLSIPIGRLADRANRRNIIALSLGVWSGMTALGGLASSFLSLVMFRVGVAAGEAGSIPASQSIIADLYPPAKRATAMSIWGLSLPLGLLLGYSVTGWLAEAVGWRWTFAIIGGFGVVLAPIVLFLLAEPKRGTYDDPVIAVAPSMPIGEATLFLWRHKAFCMVVLAAALHGFTQYSLMNWTAPFYVRVHDMSLSGVALYLALVSGIGGGIGMFLGGYFSDRVGRRDPRGRLLVMAFFIAAMVPFTFIQFSSPSLGLSLASGAIAGTLMLGYYGPILAVVHSMVPSTMRAFTASVLLLVFNIIGLGAGPFTTGLVSDIFAASFNLGNASLTYAILCSLAGSIASVAIFLLAARGAPAMSSAQAEAPAKAPRVAS